MEITDIKPRNDNVLVCFQIHEGKTQERTTPGGIIIPLMSNTDATSRGGVYATVISAGPGRFNDKWHGHEKGLSFVGSKVWVPMDPAIRPGAKVLLDSEHTGQRVVGDDYTEYRLVVQDNIIAVVEE